MNKSAVMTLAATAALLAAACGNTDVPGDPIAASSPPATIAPPSTTAPEVPLPPLPRDITAAPDPAPAAEAKARDTAANQPKEELTKTEEVNAMPKALHGNNHSSPALDKPTAQN